jgi:WD40 repeat protein
VVTNIQFLCRSGYSALVFLLLAALGSLHPAFVHAAGMPTVTSNSYHSDVVDSIVFGPNGQWFATGSRDTTIKIWDVASRRLLRTLVGHKKQVTSLSATPQGQLISVSFDNTIKIWNPETGELLRSVSCCPKPGQFITTLSSAFLSPNGRSIFVNATTAIIQWDLATNALKEIYTPSSGHDDQVETFAMSLDGRTMAVAHWVFASDHTIFN